MLPTAADFPEYHAREFSARRATSSRQNRTIQKRDDQVIRAKGKMASLRRITTERSADHSQMKFRTVSNHTHTGTPSHDIDPSIKSSVACHGGRTRFEPGCVAAKVSSSRRWTSSEQVALPHKVKPQPSGPVLPNCRDGCTSSMHSNEDMTCSLLWLGGILTRFSTNEHPRQVPSLSGNDGLAMPEDIHRRSLHGALIRHRRSTRSIKTPAHDRRKFALPQNLQNLSPIRRPKRPNTPASCGAARAGLGPAASARATRIEGLEAS